MTQIFVGNYTVKNDEPFVLFLIGMRINRPFQVRKWWSVAKEMAPMLRTLEQHPEKGFLGGYTALNWPTILLVQYWRSVEHLERFARNREDPHAGAWQRFYQNVGKSAAVGIWHETYRIEPGRFECIYGNMPKFGLGTVFEHVPVTKATLTAQQRRASVANEA